MDSKNQAKEKVETTASHNAEPAGMCPMVVSRERWGATAPLSRHRLTDAAKKAVIHHTALWPCAGPRQCFLQLQHIQKLHMVHRGWDDIGYNFLVGEDGSVFEGRGWGIVGAHTKGNNHDSIGIAFIGDFNNQVPTSAALSAARQLLQCGVDLGHLHPKYTLLGHRDLADTECPGKLLYTQLQFLNQNKF
ncbi:peptidoglycan recognition protein 5 [Paramormyrops kingsleyae]|uniref:peptidoglycan recognition protein 5 n=1 Tax=Paramormyrops kingsleyae TaxID=1676925 RepID=UPI003B96F393